MSFQNKRNDENGASEELRLFEYVKQLSPQEAVDQQIEAVIRLRGQLTYDNLQMVLDSKVNLVIQNDVEGEEYQKLAEEKLKLYLKMLRLTQISFQLDQISAAFNETLQCKDLSIAAVWSCIQFIAEFLAKRPYVCKQHLLLLLKQFKHVMHLAEQHYYGFVEAQVSKQNVMTLTKLHASSDFETVLVFQKSRYAIANNALREGPKWVLIRLLKLVAASVQQGLASLFARLLPILGTVVEATFSYPQEYFNELEEFVQLILQQRSKMIEVTAFGRQIYVPPIDQLVLDKFKVHLSPLLQFDKLRFAFIPEFEKSITQQYTTGVASAESFFKQFDIAQPQDKALAPGRAVRNGELQAQSFIVRALAGQIERSPDCGGVLYPFYRESRVLKARDAEEYMEITKTLIQRKYQSSKQLAYGRQRWLRLLPAHLIMFRLDFTALSDAEVVDFFNPFRTWPLISLGDAQPIMSQALQGIAEKAILDHFDQEHADDWRNALLSTLRGLLSGLKAICVAHHRASLSAQQLHLLRLNFPAVKTISDIAPQLREQDRETLNDFVQRYQECYATAFGLSTSISSFDGAFNLLQAVNGCNAANVVSAALRTEEIVVQNRLFTRPEECLVPREFVQGLVDRLGSQPIGNAYKQHLQAMALGGSSKKAEAALLLANYIANCDCEALQKLPKYALVSESESEVALVSGKCSIDAIQRVINTKTGLPAPLWGYFVFLQTYLHHLDGEVPQPLQEAVTQYLARVVDDFISVHSYNMQTALKAAMRANPCPIFSTVLGFAGQKHKSEAAFLGNVTVTELFVKLFRKAGFPEWLGTARSALSRVFSYKILVGMVSDIRLETSGFKHAPQLLKGQGERIQSVYKLAYAFYDKNPTTSYCAYSEASAQLGYTLLTPDDFARDQKLLGRQITQFYTEDIQAEGNTLAEQLLDAMEQPVYLSLKRYIPIDVSLKIPAKLLFLSLFNGTLRQDQDMALFKLLCLIRSKYDSAKSFYANVMQFGHGAASLSSEANEKSQAAGMKDGQQPGAKQSAPVVQMSISIEGPTTLDFSCSGLPENTQFRLTQDLKDAFQQQFDGVIDSFAAVAEMGLSEKDLFFPLCSGQILDFLLFFIQKAYGTSDNGFSLFGNAQNQKLVDMQMATLYRSYQGEELGFVAELQQRRAVNLTLDELQDAFKGIFSRQAYTKRFSYVPLRHVAFELFASIYNMERVTFTTETLQLLLAIHCIAPNLAEKILQVKDSHDLPGALPRFCLLKEISLASVFLNLFQALNTFKNDAQIAQLMVLLGYCNQKQTLLLDRPVVQEFIQVDSAEKLANLSSRLMNAKGSQSKADQVQIDQLVNRRPTVQLLAALHGPDQRVDGFRRFIFAQRDEWAI